jgi:hypothetical protein
MALRDACSEHGCGYLGRAFGLCCPLAPCPVHYSLHSALLNETWPQRRCLSRRGKVFTATASFTALPAPLPLLLAECQPAQGPVAGLEGPARQELR